MTHVINVLANCTPGRTLGVFIGFIRGRLAGLMAAGRLPSSTEQQSKLKIVRVRIGYQNFGGIVARALSSLSSRLLDTTSSVPCRRV